MSAFLWFLLIVVVLAIVIVVLARFYERATREVSLVKTGVGGRRIVMDGGAYASTSSAVLINAVTHILAGIR